MKKIYFHYNLRFGWIIFFKWRLSFKDTFLHGLTFSERNGYKKRIQVGIWSISLEKIKL
jgi:hypothetical protein